LEFIKQYKVPYVYGSDSHAINQLALLEGVVESGENEI